MRYGIEILRSRRSFAVVAGMKTPTQNRQKSNAKKPLDFTKLYMDRIILSMLEYMCLYLVRFAVLGGETFNCIYMSYTII